MTNPQDKQDSAAFARLAQRLYPDGALLRVWPLAGGVSAQMTALAIDAGDGSVHKLIVRQHGPADRARNPEIARDEFRLLAALHAAGLPVPAPVDLDTTGEFFTTPAIVIEYIEGATDFAPADLGDYLRQFAAQLAQIHRVDLAAFDLAFLPQLAENWANIIGARPERLDESLEEGRIRDALVAAWPWPQHNPTGLLHGDFWPGNILWRDGRLVGVVDWEDAALGDPLADLAITRLDVLWALGMEATRRVTDLYALRMGIDLINLPYWDLCAALRPAGRLGDWAADAAAEARMRERHRLFVAQAFARLAAQHS